MVSGDAARNGLVVDQLDRDIRDCWRKRREAFEVARAAHVHCVRQRRHRRPRFIVTGAVPIEQGAIAIGGEDDRADRRAHRAGEEKREAVAEIAGGDDEAGRIVRMRLRGAEGGMGAIGGLWQQAPEVDAVGRGQPEAVAELRVGEGELHQPLAIVEVTVHLDRGDIIAPAGELAFLERRNAALGIEDDRADRASVFGGATDRSAGVARGGGEDGQRLGAGETVETGEQEARAEILEGAGRPVEQLERAQGRAVAERGDERDWKGKGFGADGVEFVGEGIVFEERTEPGGGEVGQGAGFGEATGRVHRNGERHKQAAVGGRAHSEGGGQTDQLRAFTRTDEFHAAARPRSWARIWTPSLRRGER